MVSVLPFEAADSFTEDNPLKAKVFVPTKRVWKPPSLPIRRMVRRSPNSLSIQVSVHLPFSTTRPVIYPFVRLLDCLGPMANLLGVGNLPV